MTPLHGTANSTDARKFCLSSARRTHAKSATRRPLASPDCIGIAIRPVTTRRGQTPRIRRFRSVLGSRRFDNKRVKHVHRLLAIVDVGAGDYRPQGHAAAIRRQVPIVSGLVTDLPRSTGLGPVSSPFFLMGILTRRGISGPN